MEVVRIRTTWMARTKVVERRGARTPFTGRNTFFGISISGADGTPWWIRSNSFRLAKSKTP